MNKARKLKNNHFWDSKSIVHEEKLLNDILFDTGWIPFLNAGDNNPDNAPQLVSGVTALDTINIPKYRIKYGEVIMKGIIRGPAGKNAVLATLPTYLQPETQLPFPCRYGNFGVIATILVDGTVQNTNKISLYGTTNNTFNANDVIHFKLSYPME